jgi:UDP-N-acetylglucosamine/UDP-N-acetylgalactosamine diphosphorylase
MHILDNHPITYPKRSFKSRVTENMILTVRNFLFAAVLCGGSLFGADENLLAKQRLQLEKQISLPTLLPLQKFHDAGKKEHVALGQKLLEENQVACLILAGGQGTRLGYHTPKGCVPVSVIKQKSLFQLLCEKCLAASDLAGVPLHLAIMTSPLNHEETLCCLKESNWFGLKEEQIDLFQQEMLPFLNDKGNWMYSADKRIEGPDGNGSALKSFYLSNIWQKWKALGITLVNVIPVDNPLADPFDAELCGFTAAQELDACTKVIEKKDPEERLGVCGTDGEKLFVVEYSELPQEEKEARDKDGSLRWKVGNLSLFCFSLDFLLKMGSDPCLELPWHLAYKKAEPLDTFGWKFETFLFDVLPLAKRWGALLYPREECFSPLKNREGPESFESVRRDLLKRDREIFLQITGKEPPDRPFELDPHFYYPTSELLKKWQGKELPNENYIK